VLGSFTSIHARRNHAPTSYRYCTCRADSQKPSNTKLSHNHSFRPSRHPRTVRFGLPIYCANDNTSATCRSIGSRRRLGRPSATRGNPGESAAVWCDWQDLGYDIWVVVVVVTMRQGVSSGLALVLLRLSQHGVQLLCSDH
jgi:hypothetical protein